MGQPASFVMKVLIPNYRSPDSFVDNVAATLERMGVEVATLPKKLPFSSSAGRVWSRSMRSAPPRRWSSQERFSDAFRTGCRPTWNIARLANRTEGEEFDASVVESCIIEDEDPARSNLKAHGVLVSAVWRIVLGDVLVVLS